MKWSKKQWTKILIGLAIFDIAGQVASYFQTKDQLLSPLIPESTITHIAQPYLINAIFSAFCVIIAFILYYNTRYIASMIICGITLIIPSYLFYLLFG
jgi:hypothetical protein